MTIYQMRPEITTLANKAVDDVFIMESIWREEQAADDTRAA